MRGPTARGGYVAPLVRVWVYADGRMIWARRTAAPRGFPQARTRSHSGYLEQRLTPEGVELLRSRLVATGLFDRSLTLLGCSRAGDREGSDALDAEPASSRLPARVPTFIDGDR